MYTAKNEKAVPCRPAVMCAKCFREVSDAYRDNSEGVAKHNDKLYIIVL